MVTAQWVQPIEGKAVTWRHLKVGDLMDLDAAYNRADVSHLKEAASLAMRIVSVEGHTGKFSHSDFRGWEPSDYVAFREEVEAQEAARAHAFATKRTGQSLIADLERKVDAAQMAATQFGQALQAVLIAAKAAENASGPLRQGESSSS